MFWCSNNVALVFRFQIPDLIRFVIGPSNGSKLPDGMRDTAARDMTIDCHLVVDEWHDNDERNEPATKNLFLFFSGRNAMTRRRGQGAVLGVRLRPTLFGGRRLPAETPAAAGPHEQGPPAGIALLAGDASQAPASPRLVHAHLDGASACQLFKGAT